MEKLAVQAARSPAAAAPPSPTPGPADPMPDAYWDAVLRDPRACSPARAPASRFADERLSEMRRHLLRVSCRRCDSIIEIQTVDAMRLYGSTTSWKDAGRRLLDDSCRNRTGSHEDDGCWPAFD